MADKKDKGKIGEFLIKILLLAIVFWAVSAVFIAWTKGGGITMQTVIDSLTNTTTLAIAGCLLLVVGLFMALGIKPKEGGLKGKDKMDNQHFLSEKELDKNFKHYYFDELKNISLVGVPFRAKYNKGKIKIHFSDACHALIVGATGTGKTVSWMEPTIQILSELKNKPSMFITDPKGELYAHHGKKLQNCGYKVLQLDLTNPYSSAQWNPLEFIYTEYQRQLHMEENILRHTNDPIKNYPNFKKAGEISDSEWYEFNNMAFSTLEETLTQVEVEKAKIKDDCMDSLKDIATAIVPSEGDAKDKSWTEGARDYFNAVLIAMLEDSENPALGMTKDRFNFYNAYKIAMNKDDDFNVVKRYFQGRSPLSKTKQLAANIVQTKAQVTRDGYMSQLANALAMFGDAGICYLTARNEIDFSAIDECPTAFFIKIPDERATRYKLASVCIAQSYKEFVSKARANESINSDKMAHLKRPLYYLMDEFANLPKVADLEHAITVARSRWIYYNMAIQSYNQLDHVYGEQVAKIVRGQCKVTLFYGTPDINTREEFSKELGKQTIEVTSKSNTKGEGKDKSKSSSVNTQLQEVPLVQPSDLSKIPLGDLYVSIFQQFPVKSVITPCFKCTDVYLMGAIEEVFRPGRRLNEQEIFYDIENRNRIILGDDDDD